MNENKTSLSLQVLCFWTVSIVLSISKNSPIYKTQRFEDWILSLLFKTQRFGDWILSLFLKTQRFGDWILPPKRVF
jgi:hypothetical protein